MKSIFFSFLLLLFVKPIFGQAEKTAHKNMALDIEQYYNDSDFEAIFKLFSAEMQVALPLPKTIAFFEGLQSDAGKIVECTFYQYEQSFASYKTKFENGIFALNISLDADSKINGLFIKPFKDNKLPKMERNISKLKLPFKGEWFVFWGGDNKKQNYHVEHEAQKGAFDIIILDEKGKSHKNNGDKNEDYYAFGKELFAPCDAEVVLAVDGIKDNKPGIVNPIYVPGNTVILKTANNEYLFFAHFKQFSIKVKQGQKVKQGALLGLCGNSGNSTEAHLHFHIQNVEDMNTATGIKCYFDKIIVNGELKNDYSPVKNERIKAE